MSSEEPFESPDLADEWEEIVENQPTRERIYAVALQLYEPTSVKEAAERANVSKETARDYLKWFTEMGMLTQDAEAPDMFSRNEAYFEWRRVQRLASLSEDELEERLQELTEEESEYRKRYDADGPGDVDALDHANYDEVEEVWMDLQEWRTIRRRIREVERARRSREGTAAAPA